MHFDYAQCKQKGFVPVLVLIGIVVMVAVAGGAYFLGKSQNPKPQSQNPVVTSQVNPSPSVQPVQTTPSSIPDETANWKTYTNTKYGFSFKYPQEFSLQIEADIDVTDQPGFWLMFINPKIIKNYSVFRLILVKTSLGPEEWMRSQNVYFVTSNSCTSLKSGSVPQSVRYDSTNGHYAIIDTLFRNNGILFDFNFVATAPNKPHEESTCNIYNQILSTFKFTN